jgi:hypothetical protein
MGLRVLGGGLLAIFAFAGGSAWTVSSAQSQSDGRQWDLGRGFTAVATTENRVRGGMTARRTLEIRHDGELLRRFTSNDEGLGVQVGAVRFRGVRELLALDYQDGTGACGTYRLYGGPRLREIWVRSACADTRVARLRGDVLIVWSAVLRTKTRASGGSPHCCWRVWRHRAMQWNGREMRVVRSGFGSAPAPSYRERLLPGALPPAP